MFKESIYERNFLTIKYAVNNLIYEMSLELVLQRYCYTNKFIKRL